MTTTLQDRDPWIHRSVQNDKLRVRERYWRQHNQAGVSIRHDWPCIIPDGVTWRKHLKSITMFTEHCKNTNFVLLESAVECMDYRNSSPCVSQSDGSIIKESAAMQERNRLTKLMQAEKIHTFCDLSAREEELDEWDLLRYSDLTTEERCKHALLRAGKMFDPISNGVYLVVDNESKEEMKGIADETAEVISIDELVVFLVKHELLDTNKFDELIAAMERCEVEYKRRNHPIVDNKVGTEVFSYITQKEVEEGLRNGSLLRGKLEVSKQNAREAYVSTSKERYFLNQKAFHFNRAIHHDVVIIQPLPISQWGHPIGRQRLVHHHVIEDGDTDDTSGSCIPTARVVAIAEISRRTYVATLVDTPAVDDNTIFVVPMDIRIPSIRIRTSSWQRFLNSRLLVEIDGWDVDSNYPHGHCTEIIGVIGDLETEIACLLSEHEIRLQPFSMAAIACLPPQGIQWKIPSEEIRERRDYRNTRRIFSVDPPGCQDIDDTMHAEILPNGDIEVGVHIADVTYFVKHNSALDLEAQVRGTTFYLVDRRFDMLPSLLSSNLCSLHGNIDRLTLSVVWTMSRDFNTIKSVWYGRTVIHNCQAMTYEQAHNIMHDLPPDDLSKAVPPPFTAGAPVDRSLVPALKKDLGILTQLARKLRKDREALGGAVDLSNADFGSELKFSLDGNGIPIKVSSKKELEIHHTIAEMMIMANQSVAEKIYAAFPHSALLRIHSTVSEDRFEDLQSALKAGGIEFDGKSNMALARSLKQAALVGKNAAIVNSLWQSLATRAMSKALYICTGSQEKGVGLSHYGLGINKYTHFTSPIRRYADVVVHKQLLASLAIHERAALMKPPPGFSNQRRLSSIPNSVVLSIERGEGLQARDNDDTLNDLLSPLIEGTSKVALAFENISLSSVIQKKRVDFVVYESNKVSSICDILNKQNTMSKYSSFVCQRLFLSLYFRAHVETAPAVITDIRENGLLVYVPNFDIKGPVFLSDINGNVHIDPNLVGLSQDSGSNPNAGFAASGFNRLFPTAMCVIQDSADDRKRILEIVIPGAPKKLSFQTLDVINVQISCDFSDIKARIPQPRFQLVAMSERPGRSMRPLAKTLEIIKTDSHKTATHGKDFEAILGSSNLFATISTGKIMPCLENTAFRCDKSNGKGTSSLSISNGRRNFGRFVNPDTRTAQQDAAVIAASESAAQRRAIVEATVVKRSEYDRQQYVEKSVTTRTQKLAAFKRSAKKGKTK